MECCNHGPECSHLRVHYLCDECKTGKHPIKLTESNGWVRERITESFN